MKVLSLLVSFAAAVRVVEAVAFTPRQVDVAHRLAPRQPDVAADLKTLVQEPSSVSVDIKARWSEYNAPLPAVVVRVGIEKDIALIVEYCSKLGIPFLAQNGGIGWAKTFDLGRWGVLIDLSGLNKVTVAADKKTATIGGGASIGDVIDAANAAGALVITGNCNCVGALGAMLGGGYGNLMGEVGFGVDNILSLRVIVASGAILTVSPTSHPDLFWALRGAGPNFGIVVSATVNAIPAHQENDRTAYINNLFFSPDKLQQVAQAVEDLPLTPSQRVYLVLTTGGPPLNEPSILVTGLLRKGSKEEGDRAFKAFYDIGPISNSSEQTSYEHWNDANINFCTREGRKPSFSSTITSMSAAKWPEIWDLYTAFQAKGPNSAVLIERYNLTKAASMPQSSAAMNEALRGGGTFSQAIVIPWYEDASLDEEAVAFGKKVRGLLTKGVDARNDPTYANFAFGDETLNAIYGSSLGRLKEVKGKWDPRNRFNQWFPISGR